MTNGFKDDPQISRDYINVNVGKRVRMECELSNLTISGNMKGLWLRLEDAEVFFYSTSRINFDQRFQIEQRPILHINNGTSYEIMTYSLTIDDVRLDDSGTYSCQEDNRVIKLFLLNIVERPYFVTHEYTTLLRTQMGKNVSIACEAQGKPSPFVSWIKKIDDHQPKTMINCTTTPTTCQLNLLNVNRWHHGIYECVATNSIGTIGRFYTLDVQFPPDVYSSKVKSYHSIGDTITFECLIDANPEPDIRWLHRFTDDINQEMDLSRQYNQGSYNNKRRDSPIWSITQEKINSTRWKTILFIKHIPKRFFNSKFICRAKNRHGQNEKSITVIQNHNHHLIMKKHRHTVTSTRTPTTTTISDFQKQYSADEYQSTSTIHFLSQETDELSNYSKRLSPYLFYSFILTLYSFVQ